METTTDTAGASPPPKEPRRITGGEYKGHTYETYMHDADQFSFLVLVAAEQAGDPAIELFRSAPEHVSAGRAEGAAERWISERIKAKDASVEVGGWRITLQPDGRGTYNAEVRAIDTGEAAPVDFTGYLERDHAQDDAMTWAGQHPRLAETATPPEASPATDSEQQAPADPPPATHDAPAQASTPTPQPPKAPKAAAKAPARSQPGGSREVSVVDLEEHARLADEYTKLCSECIGLENDIKELKSDLKAKQVRLGNLAGKMAKGMQALRDGRSAGPFQTRLPMPEPAAPFGATPAAGDAAQREADKLKPATFKRTINAVEHEFVVNELGPNQWRAHIRGLDADTEGFGETYDQAVAACDGRASIHFADCNPGETTPTVDTAPLADGAAPAAKKSRKGKAKLAGKTHDQVVAALCEAMNLDEAATTIGCTVAELEEHARQTGMKLSDHLARDTGKDEPPRSRTSKKTPTNKPSAKAGRAGGKRGRK